jgi:hypothetical protein
VRLAGLVFLSAVATAASLRRRSPVRVNPRLKNRASGYFVDMGAGPFAADIDGGQRPLRLNRRQAFVPKLYRAAGRIGHALRQGSRLACCSALATSHIEWQSNYEAGDALLLCK